MSKDSVISLAAPAAVSDPLTDLLRQGTRQLITTAVAAEFEEYLSAYEEERLEDGRRRVVRNGHLPERRILTWVGAVMLGGAYAKPRLYVVVEISDRDVGHRSYLLMVSDVPKLSLACNARQVCVIMTKFR